MATRIRLPSAGAADVSPAFDASWNSTGSADRIRVGRGMQGTAPGAKTVAEAVSTSPYDVLVRQFVSDPIQAQTITGTIKGIISVAEANADADYRAQMVVRVVSNDGSTVRGTLLGMDTSALSNEFNATNQNRKFPLNYSGSGASLTSVTAQDGDRLVIEVGFRSHNTHTTSRNATFNFRDELITDCDEDETVNGTAGTSTAMPWVEFSQDILWKSTRFYLGGTAAITPTADAAWGQTSNAVVKKATANSKLAGTNQTINGPETSTSVLDALLVQAVSDPIQAQTITGYAKGVFRVKETDVAADMRSQVVIRVVSNDGSTVRGTLLAADTAALGSDEWPTANTFKTAPRTTHPGAALTSVTAQDGDRLVFEVGYRAHNTVATSYTGSLIVRDSAGLDGHELGGATSASLDSWIELSQPILFSTTQSVAVSGIASAEAVGTATVVEYLTPSGIASGEAMGTPTVVSVVAPTGIATAEALGTAKVVEYLTPSGIASGEALGSPTVATGAVSVAPSGIASAEALGTAKVVEYVTPSGIASGEAVGTPTIANVTTSVVLYPTVVTIDDDFGDGTLDPAWGTFAGDDFTFPYESGGKLVLPASNLGYYGINRQPVDFTGASWTAEVETVSTGLNSDTYLTVFTGAANYLQMAVQDGVLYLTVVIASVPTYGSVTYNATTHRWWRVREFEGTGYVETSPDGVTWTVQLSASGDTSGLLTDAWIEVAAGNGTDAEITRVLFEQRSGVPSAGTVGSPTVTAGASPQTVSPSGIASTEALGSATVVPGAVTVAPAGIATAEALGTAKVNLAVVPTGIPTGEAVGTPSVSLYVVPTGIASGEAIGAPNVQGGAQTVAPSGLASAEAVGTPTVVPGAVSVAPSGIATGEAVGTPQVNLTVAPSGIASGEALGTATVQGGAQTIAPSGLASAEALGNPTVARGAVTLAPTGITTGEAFGTASVVRVVGVTGIATAEAFGTTEVNLAVVPTGISSAEAVGTPTVVPPAAKISPTGIASAEALGTATLLRGVVVILPAGVATAEAFGTAVVSRAPVSAFLTSYLERATRFIVKVEEDNGGSSTVTEDGAGTSHVNQGL